MTTSQLLTSATQLETRLCLAANRMARRQMWLVAFRAVSRLGDGVFWYALMAVLPLWLGRDGVLPALHMLATGGVCLVVYKQLKSRLVRERPFVRLTGIQCLTPPLDRYSFPSGHTLHAVAFTIVACHHLPGLAALLLPFTVAIAASRVILGLHYPSDVLAGAAIGGGIALGSIQLIG